MHGTPRGTGGILYTELAPAQDSGGLLLSSWSFESIPLVAAHAPYVRFHDREVLRLHRSNPFCPGFFPPAATPLIFSFADPIKIGRPGQLLADAPRCCVVGPHRHPLIME